MKVELVTKTVGVGRYESLNSEEIISAIARHGVIKEDNGKLVKYLMSNAHWSPLDMINFTFEIETSRAIGRQILRHASIKFQEHSQRYSDKVEFEEIELRREDKVNRQSSTEVFNPIINRNGSYIQNEETASDLIIQTLDYLEEIYQALLKAGVAKECARFILPECTRSTLSANGTLRSWLSFLNVRCDHHAQKECQDIASLIGIALEKEMPNVFSTINWRTGMFIS
jgi:thymidylate synthase (FAD)